MSFFKGVSTEEKQDYVQNYNVAGTAVRNTQIFYYEDGSDTGTELDRASTAGVV